MTTSCRRALVLALVLFSPLAFAQDAASITKELLALRPGVTARAWLATHPKDKFEVYPAGGQDIVEWEIFRSRELSPGCAVATATLTFGDVQYLRRVAFRLPDDAALRVPPGQAPHPELVMQCVVSEIHLRSLRGVGTTLPAGVESAISSALGASEPFRFDLFKGAILDGASDWVNPREWNARASRWIVAVTPKDGRFEGVALSSVANRNPLVPDRLAPELALAREFLPMARMPADETGRMKQLLDTPPPPGDGGSGVLPAKPETVASLLAHWASLVDAQASEATAARLFIAHVALKHAARFDSFLENPDVRDPLNAAGADVDGYEPCGCFAYSGVWIVKAWRAAPESAPGRQAYLMQLALGFDARGTCRGDPDEVVSSGQQYLKEHPLSPIRHSVMLHVADGYAEKIALQHLGPEYGGSDEEARKALPVALQYYRRVMKLAPGSAEAREAKRSAWAMLAIPAGLPVRWNCLGGD